MTYLKAIAGALAIMATSGMITDFDLTEKGREIHVHVWSPASHADSRLEADVAVLLSRYVSDRPLVVTGSADA